MTKKLLLVGLVIFSMLVISSSAMAQPSLIVEFISDEWFAGIQHQQTKRQMIGFLGYQEDYSSLLLGINTNANQITGQGSVGRRVYVGNFQYQVGASAGYLDRTMNLGIVGDVKQVNNKFGYGFRGELNILQPTISGQPYVEFRENGVLRTTVGFGSHPVYLQLDYNMKSDLLSDVSIFARINLERDYEYGLDLVFLDKVGLSIKLNNDRDLAAKLSYKFEI